MQRAELIAIGSELLLGGRLDTNSLFLTEELAAQGIEVRFKTVVNDDEADIEGALRIAARRADVVVLTGGLGPTKDDRTRRAVARVTGRPLRRQAEALAGMKRRLAAWGRTPTPAQMRQALIPSGATVLANPVGSAPGFCLSWKGCVLIALPGVPAEAKGMYIKEAVPRLAELLPTGKGELIERRALHTFGVPESDLDALLKRVVPSRSGIRLGLQASPRGVTISLTMHGKPSCRAILDRVAAAVREAVGSTLYAEGTDTMEEVVGRYLTARGLTLAVAESCTGGLIGHRLTQVPGSSTYLDRVVVCYSNQSKSELLGVPEELIAGQGAVSGEVATAMARGVRERSRSDIGLSVTGIAGPGGATEQKPVGLVYVGLDVKGRANWTEEFRFHGPRDVVKLRASQAALNLLRLRLVAPGATG